MLLGKFIGFFLGNFPFVSEIYLVTYKNFDDFGVCMLVNALEPSLHIIEGDLVGNIVGNNDTIGLLVEGVSNGFESLLTCCVPYLYSYILPCWCFVRT